MKVVLIIVGTLFCSIIKAQNIVIDSYINAWKLSNKSQSHASQVLYDSMRYHQTREQFIATVNALQEYLKSNANIRLKVRLLMYKALGQREFHINDNKSRAAIAMQAIKSAYPLKDEQLNAELYALYADMIPSVYDYLFYNLKALQIQKKIGLEHFAYIQNRFFGVSNALYMAGDYRYSIKYGIEGLSVSHIDTAHWDNAVRIIQTDVIASAYKKLNQYDSAAFYYKQILNTLHTLKFNDYSFETVWRGIALGNIGLALAKKKNFEEALPLINEYLNASCEIKDTLNIAMAYNHLADAYFNKGNFSEAANAWKKALAFAQVTHNQELAANALKALGTFYKKAGNTDSAIFYITAFHEVKDSIDNMRRESNYASVTRQLEFDNLQLNLEHTEFAVMKLRRTRNALISGSVLLTVIALLLYNRRLLKQELKMKNIQAQNDKMQAEAEASKIQIANFTKNIIEKEKIIHALSLQTDVKDAEQKRELLENSLQQFMLVNEDDWARFRAQFAVAYPAFLASLRGKAANISQAEERLAILMFLRLGSSHIAQTLGISRESVNRAKRRLKIRFSLNTADSLEDFIAAL